jgi:hypothetical protein
MKQVRGCRFPGLGLYPSANVVPPKTLLLDPLSGIPAMTEAAERSAHIVKPTSKSQNRHDNEIFKANKHARQGVETSDLSNDTKNKTKYR